MSRSTTRRTFLQVASTSLASATAFSSLAVSPSFAGAPSDKVRIGLIGCGGRGLHDAELFQNSPNVEVAYVCDPDAGRLAIAAKKFNVPSQGVIADMRKMLDDKSLDAVIVTTPDHWHSPASILACEAGKHVYVEKPISHNIRESRLLVEAAAKNKVQVQHGTQSRSTQMMIEAVKLLRDGIIGPVLVAKCWNIQRRGSIGRGQDTSPPA